MNVLACVLLLALQQNPGETRVADTGVAELEEAAKKFTDLVSENGAILQLGQNPSTRVVPEIQISPGGPPLLSFRYFEGKDRHRFGKLDLLLDDAGH